MNVSIRCQESILMHHLVEAIVTSEGKSEGKTEDDDSDTEL